MAQDVDYKNKLLFHFTHIDNLASIVQNGLICDNLLTEGAYTNSGNSEIKARRSQICIDNDLYVSDFVPFYFAPRSPMLYMQYINGRIKQEKIIYLVTKVEAFISGNILFYFSNMNAARSAAVFYNNISDLDKVSWSYMESDIWMNTDVHPDRMQHRMAEFLVHQKILWSQFLGVGVYDEKAVRLVEAIIPEGKPVIIKTSWYY